MTQAPSADYSTLKDTLLEMWVPVVGVQTAADFWTKNLEKIFGHMFQIGNIPEVLYHCIERWSEVICKDQVFKRNFESYFDSHSPFQLSEAILTGSLSEGLFLYTVEPPDMDFMCVLKNITISQESQEDGSLLSREDTPFVYAFITNKETQNLWTEFLDDADQQAGKHRLSSRKLKEKLEENYQKAGGMFNTLGTEELEEVTEGAAVTIRKAKPASSFMESIVKTGTKALRTPINERCNLDETFPQMMHAALYEMVPSSDIVLSIFCEGWPSCAREWITRERLWPDIYSVEKITHGGFHIVPKSSSHGDFRLSFTCVETTLVQTLSPLQHKVMRAFKAVVKYHENTWSPNLKEIISSYHLKTIAFWHFEKTSQESWTEETLIHHLVTLLEELAKALRMRNLPMYFMPKVNLLQDVDDPEVTLDLIENILQLSHNFSAISEAVDNDNTLREIFGSDSEHNNIRKIFDTLREEKLKKAEDGESSCTWYDLFVTIDKLVN